MFRAGLFVPFVLLFLVACAKQQTAPPLEVLPVDAENPAAAMPVPGGEGVEEMQVNVVDTVE